MSTQRFNTGNPIGSNSPLDRSDNTRNLDVAVNAEQDTFQDRLGESRLTWAGIVKAGTGEAGVIVPIVQQAVQDVIDGVEGQVGRAALEADRAETARDAAFVNADVYPDVATGRAAVADGEQFQVMEGDEVVRYQRDSASAQTEVARYPASAMVRRSAQDITRGIQVANQSPNLLSANLVDAMEKPVIIGLSTVELISVAGINSIFVKSSPTGVSARTYWTLPASAFSSGLISASVVLVSANPGASSGGVSVIQRDSSRNQLDRTMLVNNTTFAITEPTIFSVAGVPLHPDAVRIDLDIDLYNSASYGPREFVAQFPMLADGDVAGFRHPITLPPLPDSGDALEQASNVLRYEYALPLDIAVLIPDTHEDTGYVNVTPAISSQSSAVSLDIRSRIGDSMIGAAELGQGLRGGEVLRLVFTPGGGFNPAYGLLFGDIASARGLAIRENGQVLTLTTLPHSTGTITNQDETFSQGDRIAVDARVHAGSAGNYTVRYFVEYPDGTRIGPYDVSGIESLERAWYGARHGSSGVTTANNVELFRFRAPRYSDEWGGSGSGSNIVYVSTSGDDSNLGTSGSPFRTISKGVSSLSGGGIVEVEGGEYRETVTSNSQDSIWIRSKKGERAFLLGSEQLSPTKTAGYSQVYQAPLASKPTGMGGNRGKPVIFEWGTPSKPIPVEERHALQRGRTHRLPYTEMFEAESKEILDTPEGMGMWWWEEGVIFFAATDGSDATQKRYETRVRKGVVQTGGGLRLSRLTVMFSSSYGASFHGQAALTEDVVVLGSYHNGFSHQSGVWKSYRDESAGNGNDGFNGTVENRVNVDDDSGDRITAFFYDPYGHDNGDDGTSYHFRGDATFYGGLFEHNTKADVIHVTGAAITCYGTVARGTGQGFSSASEPTSDGSREFTSFRCVGTKAINNGTSYRVSNGVLECDNAVAINPRTAGYVQANDGVLVARNSKYTGDPEKMKSGNVEVINDGALT